MKLGCKTNNPVNARDVIETTLPEGILRILLLDHATGDGDGCKHIRWATKDYVGLGIRGGHETKGFGEWDEIDERRITGSKYGKVIQPRIDKSKAAQRARSVEKAEVFTPSWICNKQNNLVDAAWFGRKNAGFNDELDEKSELGLNMLRWQVRKQKISFPKRLKKTWLDYVHACRLEMACGEGPYLTSRYDTVNGDFINPPERIGILDRKLRVISENVKDEAEWCKYAAEALKAVYGFEYQGDNVLLARENLFESVREYRKWLYPSVPENLGILKEWAMIISWNIWQMDGLKFTIPGACPPKTVESANLFNETKEVPCPGCTKHDPKLHTGIRCRVMDWSLNQAFEFVPPFEHFKE